jgi:hypothetical protein
MLRLHPRPENRCRKILAHQNAPNSNYDGLSVMTCCCVMKRSRHSTARREWYACWLGSAHARRVGRSFGPDVVAKASPPGSASTTVSRPQAPIRMRAS